MTVARRRPLLGAALVLCAATLWATFGLFARLLYARGYTPIELASIRACVAWAGVFLILLPRPALFRIHLRDLGFFILYGVVGFALFETLYFVSIEQSSIAIAVALLYTAPAFVVLLGWLLWRERVGVLEVGALGLVLLGVLLVTGALGSLLSGRVGVTPLAASIGLASGLNYGLYTLFSKVALRRYAPLTALFWSFGFASLALLAVASPLEPMLRAPDTIPLLLALGLVPTLFAYLLYLLGLRWLAAGTASMLACIEPVVATLFAAWLLHERITAAQAVGMLLIVLAAGALARRLTAVPASGVTSARRP